MIKKVANSWKYFLHKKDTHSAYFFAQREGTYHIHLGNIIEGIVQCF